MARGKYEPNQDEASNGNNGKAKAPLLNSDNPNSSPRARGIKDDEIHELTPLKRVDEKGELLNYVVTDNKNTYSKLSVSLRPLSDADLENCVALVE